MRTQVWQGPSFEKYAVYAISRDQWLCLDAEGNAVWSSDYREAAHFNSKRLAESEALGVTTLSCLIFKVVGRI